MWMLLPTHGGFKNKNHVMTCWKLIKWPEDRKCRGRGLTHTLCMLWAECFSRCLLLCVFLTVSRNSWWSLMLNLPRCLIKLVVLYDAMLLSPLECWPYTRCKLLFAFCCSESKIAPHYFELANCQAISSLMYAISRYHAASLRSNTNDGMDMDRWCGLALSV